jgi:hypothetical protein
MACFLVALVASGLAWFWLARRYPTAAYILWGFIGGLTGCRDVYYRSLQKDGEN